MRNDLTKLFPQEPKIFEVAAQPTSHVYRVALDEVFEHSSQFAQLVELLEGANESDVFQIRLHTPGGSLDSVYPLISAMKNTEGFIHLHVDSSVASAGTLLMMCAHMVTFNEYVSIMFHNVQYTSYGHGGNVEAQTKHYTQTHEKLIRDLYKDFLDNDEIQKLFYGQEIWMQPEDVYSRLKMREEKRIAEEEECCRECEQPPVEVPKPKPKRTPRKKKETPAKQQEFDIVAELEKLAEQKED